ncbi:MAG: hypothetical protein QM536_00935 [Chitinophagaceae bacterium]|nr:hypothetical protein [Chitinophagaceae bacterium]
MSLSKKVIKYIIKIFFLYNVYRFVLDIYRNSSVIQRWFKKELCFFKYIPEKTEGIVLVQLVENYEYMIKFAAASKAIAEKKNLEVFFYNVLIDWFKIPKINVPLKQRPRKHLEKIHKSFGSDVIFNNGDLYHDQNFIQDELTKIIVELNPDKVLDITFENVYVGDLIYDTYLRFFHRPTMAIVDHEVIRTIEIGLNVYYNFKYFLKRHNVKVLLNTYSSYIHHGIPARLCLQQNIDVYTIASDDNYVIKKLSMKNNTSAPDNWKYNPEKKIPKKHLEEAKKRLESRFSGNIDHATTYMKQTSYHNIPLDNKIQSLFQEKERNIVVYAHDFYDSPHFFRELQMRDLYQYLKETLSALSSITDTQVFIKIHPNGIAGAKEQAIELVQSFNKKHFHILDESVSNLHIVTLNPTYIATARGTIGTEMPYFGIPTIALYDNIYCNFNFVYTARTKEEYFDILKGHKKIQIDFDREKIYSFYYQCYMEDIIYIDPIFMYLYSFNGNKYSDEYLKYINIKKDIVFSDILVNIYKNALDNL